MLKFKNKFKFGSSHQEPSPEASITTSPRNSTDSRKTISVNNLSDNLNKVNISEDDDEASSKAQTITNSNLNSSSSNVSLANGSSDIETPNTTVTSNPGLLTVKIYNSSNIKLPIKINNNKQILHALASNASNEVTSQQLIKNLNSLNLNEFNSPDDFLPGSISTNFLPSNITIPNGENLVKSLLYLTIEFDNNVLVIEPHKGTVNQSTWNQVVSFDVTKKTSASTASSNQTQSKDDESTGSNFLNLNLFIRLPSVLIPEQEKLNFKNLFTNSGNNIGDLLIGSIKLPLNLKFHTKPIRLMNHEFLTFTNYNLLDYQNVDDDLNDLIKNIGEIMLTIDFKPILKSHLSIEDFDLLKVIGKGSFGKVMQVVKKDTKQIYALKTLRKQHIISRMEVTHTLAERTVLARIRNPFIVPLKFSFQSPEKLYLVLSFINGGELFWHLQREGKFSMDRSRFYIAELLTALESLHDLNVIYRDLKPENILLDYQGHIALCDFGLCKLNMSNDDKTNTFCGTPEYLAPELLLNQGYTRSVDWWTLGTLLYEMVTGLPPFFDDDTSVMYRKILQNPLKFPPFLENTDVQDLLIKLLQKDPTKRLSDAQQIKNHKFFKDIDWVKLINKSYLPPFKPNVDNLLDTSNFDQEFTNEKPQDSVVDDFLSESVQKQFGGWTYNGDNVL